MIDNIKNEIIKAMKARDEIRLRTLKSLANEIKNAQIDNKNFSEEDVVDVVKKAVKQRKDSIEAYNEGGRQDLAEAEKLELDILMEYMPEQLSEEQVYIIVEKAISETNAQSMQDMGKVMGMAIKLAEGKADGSLVSKIVKEKLS